LVSGEKEGGAENKLNRRYWHGTVALDAEKIRRLASGSCLINFRFRPLQHNYLKKDSHLLKALILDSAGTFLSVNTFVKAPRAMSHIE